VDILQDPALGEFPRKGVDGTDENVAFFAAVGVEERWMVE
jgi:hypothetical protein